MCYWLVFLVGLGCIYRLIVLVFRGFLVVLILFGVYKPCVLVLWDALLCVADGFAGLLV